MPENTWLLKSIQTVLTYADVNEHDLHDALVMFEKYISDHGHLQPAPVQMSLWGKILSKISLSNTDTVGEMQQKLRRWRSLVPSQVEKTEQFSAQLMEAASQLSLVGDKWPEELHTRFRDSFVTLLVNVCG